MKLWADSKASIAIVNDNLTVEPGENRALIKVKNADLGIVICGSGNGIAMTANKHQDVRAALCWTKEIAELARQHNDANIISIPARYVSIPQAVAMVETFLTTNFEGGRHAKRVNKIACK